jgi:dsDNA-binding SOS-regulon protein
MNSSQIGNILRLVADAIESNPQVAKAVQEHLDKNTNYPKAEGIPTPTIKQNTTNHKKSNETNTVVNGETLLKKCRDILRGEGEERLKIYLIELGDNVREILKHGQLDPNRTIRRRKNLNSIIDHIIHQLIAQENSGKTLAQSIQGL